MIRMVPTVQVVSNDEAETLWKKCSNQEGFIGELRKRGSHKVECIKLLRNVAHISLGEAKEVVHFSKAWDDRRASDDKFHEDLIEALYEAGFEDQEQPAAAR